MTLVLDSESLSILARARPVTPSQSMGVAAVTEALNRGLDVLVPAAVLAELYRGAQHDQVLDSCLSRFPAIVVVDTDQALARDIGHLLARAGRGSADHVDASVVAVAVQAGGGLIVTGDLDDISALAHGVRGVRVVGV